METLPKPHHHLALNVVPDEENQIGRRSSVTGDHLSDDEQQRCSSSSSSSEIKERRRSSSVSDDQLDLKVSPHLSSKSEIVCRICHLSLEESGVGIELGCSCKHDLAAAHKHCAEAWFKIKGNKTCEICGSIARNIAGATTEAEVVEHWNEGNDSTVAASAPAHAAETQHFWQGHQFLNFLLACMVFAFVISWLFHFNVPS